MVCPRCGRLLAEIGIGKTDGRLYYECLNATTIRRTRFEPEHQVKRRLMSTLQTFTDRLGAVGHSHQHGAWGNLVWKQIPGAVTGDEGATIYLSFRYYLAGDKLIPVDSRGGPALRLPERAYEEGCWEWEKGDKSPLTDEDVHGGIKGGRGPGKKKPKAVKDPRANRGRGW